MGSIDFFGEIHRAGVGLVLRDGKGEVALAASKLENDVSDFEAIELLAILRCLQLCANMGIRKLIIKSDCLMVVQVLKKEIELAGMLDSLVNEIRKLQMLYVDCQVQHFYREGNWVAHKLAHYAWNVESLSMWCDCFPDFLVQAILFDKCL